MSLFANIFKPAKGKGDTSSLFSDKNKFRARDEETAVPAPLPKLAKTAKTGGGKRKSGSGGTTTVKEAAAAKASKKHKTTAAAPAVTGKKGDAKAPKSEAARKQAEKAKGMANAARRLDAASESDEDTSSGSDIEEEQVVVAKPSNSNKKSKKAEARKEEIPSDAEEEESASEEEEEEQQEVTGKRNINDPKVLARTIFVGNIPANAKKKALTALFQRYGSVESVRLRSVPLKKDVTLPRKAAVASGAVDPTRGSAHAYIIFTTTESARNAVKEQNMKEWLGQHLRVDMAASASVKSATGGDKAEKSANVKYDPKRSVFIGNLHLEAKDEELIRFFITGIGGGESELEAVRIVRDAHTSIGKGIAYALFKTPAGRRAALGLDGRKLRERPLRITSIKSSGGGGGSSRGGGEGGGKFKSERGTASWQGITATQSGRSRGPAGGKPLTKFSGGGRGGSSSGTRKGGKRPSVMARKQKQLGLPVTAGVKNKDRPSMGGSGPRKSPSNRK